METNLISAAKKHTFSKGSRSQVILAGKNPNEKELAVALVKTKAYKEDKELKALVDAVVKGQIPTVKAKPEPEKSATGMGGERRGW